MENFDSTAIYTQPNSTNVFENENYDDVRIQRGELKKISLSE